MIKFIRNYLKLLTILFILNLFWFSWRLRLLWRGRLQWTSCWFGWFLSSVVDVAGRGSTLFLWTDGLLELRVQRSWLLLLLLKGLALLWSRIHKFKIRLGWDLIFIIRAFLDVDKWFILLLAYVDLLSIQRVRLWPLLRRCIGAWLFLCEKILNVNQEFSELFCGGTIQIVLLDLESALWVLQLQENSSGDISVASFDSIVVTHINCMVYLVEDTDMKI